jgi:hypothetical protein
LAGRDGFRRTIESASERPGACDVGLAAVSAILLDVGKRPGFSL